MKTTTYIKELGKEYGLDRPFDSDASGGWKIPVDEALTVLVKDLNPGFRLDARVVESPRGQEDALYCQMLLANLFGQGTRGSVLGLDDDTRYLTMSQVIDYDVNFKEFKDHLEDFITAVDFWREEALNYK